MNSRNQSQSRCELNLSQGDEWATLLFSLAGTYTGGQLVFAGPDFSGTIQGRDNIARQYGMSNWFSGITSGALHAFRSLGITRQHLMIHKLEGELSAQGMQALAEGTSVAIAKFLDLESPPVSLDGWRFNVDHREDDLWKTLEVGQRISGTVESIENYGAFINLGGVGGLLTLPEISWSRLRHPGDVLNEGQEIVVQILHIDSERKTIGLGLKQLTKDPWADVAEYYLMDSTVTGRVYRTTDFGAFIELEPGVVGLVHISELACHPVNRVTDILTEGQESTFKVLEVDFNRRVIILSLKALQEDHEA